MKKLIATISLIILSTLSSYAFEDCIIKTNGRLTNIEIEDNTIIDVHPIITIMNKKDTLIIHPLKEGLTSFTVYKNNKEKFLFTVKVEKDETFISENKNFEIMYLDSPPDGFNIDLPPTELYEDLEKPPTLKPNEPIILKEKGEF